MKSIRAKLALFVSVLCVILIALVWVLVPGLLEPTYNRKITNELTSIAGQVSEIIENVDENTSGSELFAAVNDLAGQGVCIDVSADGSCLFYADGVGDNCLLHPASPVFGGSREMNSPTVVQLRERTASEGSLSLRLQEEGTQHVQKVVGTVTESGIVVLVSTGLERVDQAVSVVTDQLKWVAVVLLVIAVVSALIFAGWFTRPLRRLSDAAKQVAAGNYDISVEPKSRDEIGELTREFNNMTGEISRSSKLQKELVANFSHDLRTPLTLIQGYAETIRDLDGDNKEKRDSDCAIIVEETGRLSKLVNSMMELSKYSSGAQPPAIEEFDLAELAEDVLSRYADRANKEGFNLSRTGPEEALVKADPVQIGRVLHNLIANAIGHLNPNGSVEVRLTPKKDTVLAEVIDDGVGIAEAELPFVFDRYYRARSDAGKRGNGLGLSIVKAILVAHKAPFGVRSAEGHGAAFWFELPLAKDEEPKQ